MKCIPFLLLIAVTNSFAQKSLTNYSANLPATDALGRKLPASGTAKKDRYVGLFYWTWHYRYRDTNNKPINLSKHIQENRKLRNSPNARVSYDDSAWPTDGVYFWGEPLFGFYTSTDRWVLRKHAEMLADAGVDVIFFDCTNGSEIWKPAYTALCEVFLEARKDGVLTPQIAFVTALGPVDDGQNAINQLYSELYKPGLYKDLWFYWKGKPLLLSYPDFLREVPGNPAGTQFHTDIKNFFTFRPVQPEYNKGPERPNQWGWLEIYPQHNFVERPKGGFEEMPVSVAQNWSKESGLTAMNSPNVFGRSYTNAKGANGNINAHLYGLNFQEQWNRALKQDIELVFVTGWNEWIVGRHREWRNQKNAFPDEYTTEYSRDIEPMKGGHGDNYYYQMVANIRRFKGVPAEKKSSAKKTIHIDGLFTEWNDVQPEFKAHKGSTMHRNSPGFGLHNYVNKSGRNDIVGAKIACDKNYVYFYVQTADKLTPHTDPNWMTLFIDVDRKEKTGWEGYDLVVNRKQVGTKAIVERKGKGATWVKVASVEYAYEANRLEVKIPRSLIAGFNKTLNFEFKWSDNRQQEGNIMDFWMNGDVAPSGRYNYHYVEN